MKRWTASGLLMVCLGAQAQTSNDAERLRISTERTKLEAAFAVEDTACYSKFLVNRCLDEVKGRRRDELAYLRRQEIELNNQARKVKAAAQLQKIEDKSSPEKLQQDVSKKAQEASDTEVRKFRNQQKIVSRKAMQAKEKANADSSANRLKSNRDKQARATLKQAEEESKRKKYNDRQEKAQERQRRHALEKLEKASQAKTPAKPLPAQQ